MTLKPLADPGVLRLGTYGEWSAGWDLPDHIDGIPILPGDDAMFREMVELLDDIADPNWEEEAASWPDPGEWDLDVPALDP